MLFECVYVCHKIEYKNTCSLRISHKLLLINIRISHILIHLVLRSATLYKASLNSCHATSFTFRLNLWQRYELPYLPNKIVSLLFFY